MPAETDPDELRTLQRKAYGREGGFTDAEARRLRELERARREDVPAQLEDSPVEIDLVDAVPFDLERRRPPEVTVSEEGPSTRSETQVGGRPEDAVAGSRIHVAGRTRRLLVAGVAVAVLLCGVGLGWLLFGQSRAEAVALTSEQLEWQRALLADGVYDSGSVRAIAVEEGVVIWTATKGERERTCLILSDGEITSPNCQRTESVTQTGMSGSIIIDSFGDSQREVSAQVLFAASGEPAVAVSTYDYSPGYTGIVYANDEETVIAERLADEGYDPNSIWVVGYDRDVPLWTAMKPGEAGTCLIYDGSTPESPLVCADPQTLVEQESGLVLNVDTLSGGTTRFEMPSNGPSYLVITREGGDLGAGGD